MAKNKFYCVMSGDIVGSSDLHLRAGSPTAEVVIGFGNRVIERFDKELIPEIDVYRGDSWQMVCLVPQRSLRIGLFLRALIKSDRSIQPVDTRLSFGFGEIDYLPEMGISAGDGEAFRLSGSGLDRCGKRRRMCLAVPEQKVTSLSGGLDQIINLVDFQVQRWQPGQSEAVAGALLGYTQQEIARSWMREQVTQQTISQHLESAGWDVIKSALSYFETTLPEILSL